GRSLLPQRLAEHGPVRLRQHRLDMTRVLQHEAFCLEAVVDDGGWRVAKERIGARRIANRLLDLGPCRRQLLFGIKPDTHVELAPGRYRRRPVAAGDLADIEVDGMMMVVEPGILM